MGKEEFDFVPFIEKAQGIFADTTSDELLEYVFLALMDAEGQTILGKKRNRFMEYEEALLELPRLKEKERSEVIKEADTMALRRIAMRFIFRKIEKAEMDMPKDDRETDILIMALAFVIGSHLGKLGVPVVTTAGL